MEKRDSRNASTIPVLYSFYNSFSRSVDNTFAGGSKILESAPDHKKKRKKGQHRTMANRMKVILDLLFGEEEFETVKLSQLEDI